MNTAGDSYIWIYGIIKSCQTEFHFKAADILIELFGTLFPNHPEMKRMLIDLLVDKKMDAKNKVS